MKTLPLDGLRPDQIRRLIEIRNDMLGWEFVGCAVEIDSDYYWKRGDRTRLIEDAQRFKDDATAKKAIEKRICAELPCNTLVVVGIYRRGDDWGCGPSIPA